MLLQWHLQCSSTDRISDGACFGRRIMCLVLECWACGQTQPWVAGHFQGRHSSCAAEMVDLLTSPVCAAVSAHMEGGNSSLLAAATTRMYHACSQLGARWVTALTAARAATFDSLHAFVPISYHFDSYLIYFISFDSLRACVLIS